MSTVGDIICTLKRYHEHTGDTIKNMEKVMDISMEPLNLYGNHAIPNTHSVLIIFPDNVIK